MYDNNDHSDSSRGILMPTQERTVVSPAVLQTRVKDLPGSFPYKQWQEQSSKYAEHWAWFNGDHLGVAESQGKGGDELQKFPLHINVIRTQARKHAQVLFGEAPDSPVPLVKPLITPKTPLDDADPSEEDQKLARLCQNVTNEVWMQSSGRAIQMENGVLSQFLGGNVFQLTYQPQRTDLIVPLVIKNVRPDFFLPVWSNDNYWELLEAWVLYYIPTPIAQKQYGSDSTSIYGLSIYMEHWTPTNFSITVDFKPITQTWTTVNGIGQTTQETRTYNEDNPNPFGFVPFVYIPHQREGSLYGTSHVEDMAGLIEEYNLRMSDTGIAVLNQVEQQRWGTDLPSDIRQRQIGNVVINDIGRTTPNAKGSPQVTKENTNVITDSMINYNKMIWNQILREGYMAGTMFGEDEGSQRSALTLAFRMWPVTAHTRSERNFWTEGMNTIDWMILRMMATLTQTRPINKITIPKDVQRRLTISQDWHPQIPRDREELVNEIVLRSQTGHLSLETAINKYGDIKNPDEEVAKIHADREFDAQLTANAQGGTPPDKPGTTAGSGAIEKTTKPVIQSVVE
jgi:Phage portal protein, SPP1 Gp6-like